MKCPKCNSENVQVQAKEFKGKFIGACCLAGAGLGLCFLGLVGVIIGLVIGTILGIILNGITSNTYQSVLVCQDCGYVSQPMNETVKLTESHPLYCDSGDGNLDIVRNDIHKGTIVVIRVKVDDYAPIDIMDNSTISLKVSEGIHTISYEQVNGIGKNKNKGQLSISVDEKKNITFSFSRAGLIVK